MAIEEKIDLIISGAAMESEDGYELSYILESLSGFEKLVEKTYLFIEHKTRMNEEDKENLTMRIKNFEHGSFRAELIVQIRNNAIPLFIAAADNSPYIWSMIKNSFNYIKNLVTIRSKGDEPEMTRTGDGNIEVKNIGNNNEVTINVYPSYVETLSKDLSVPFTEIAKNVDGENIESIGFSSGENEELNFTLEDRELFKSRTLLDEQEVILDGEITVSNANSYSGKIEIFENDSDVPIGEYPFDMEKNVRNRNFLKENYLRSKQFICQRKIKIDPSKNIYGDVVEIRILGIA